MRMNLSTTGNAISGLIGFAIYAIIDLATGGSVGNALGVGVIVGIIVFVISFTTTKVLKSRRSTT